ncbi:hypothetical protein ABZX85_12845 [Streptomyces sp. NPDC004539]|uniref:hypothetical protein n=1 Tax=Streptomyces sp. NPDC004539 TaxID=3154280 RepID=UPI0033A6139A
MTTALPRLLNAADAAARAANAHNTQPWELRHRGDHIEVGWLPEYALGPSDPSHRDLRLSLGTYLETFLICANTEGTAVRFEADYDAGATRVGRIVPAERAVPDVDRAAAVERRRVWRGPWKADRVAPELLEQAQLAAREAGFRIAVVPTATARPLLIRAYHWFFGHEGIAAELLAWTRLSPKHPAYAEDGLNDVMLVLNKAERSAMGVLFSRPVYRALRPLGLVKLLTALSSSATSGDGDVLVILGTDAGPADEVEAGRLVTRLWLDLFRQGVYVHPQSHVIDCPGTHDELARLCAAEPGERPLVFFRVGHPASDPALRPRHPRR